MDGQGAAGIGRARLAARMQFSFLAVVIGKCVVVRAAAEVDQPATDLLGPATVKDVPAVDHFRRSAVAHPEERRAFWSFGFDGEWWRTRMSVGHGGPA